MSSPTNAAAYRDYAFVQSEREYERLALQAELLEPTTRRIFEEAGIAPGMRVMDLGSGAGDICLLLARIVGPSGEVIGLEQDQRAIEYARQRAAAAGLDNVRFVESDFTHHVPENQVDALVGRLVLMYHPDPAGVLGRLKEHVRPGGVIAFLEPWFTMPQGPDTNIKRVSTMILETLRRSGAQLDLGPRLHNVFTAAGLPVPSMRMEVRMDGAEDSRLYGYMRATAENLLPKALEYGVVQPGEIDLDQAIPAIRAEVRALGYAMIGMPLIGAWCRTQQHGT